MAKEHPVSVINSAGGVDLLVERDAGNTVKILTGKPSHSKKFWKQLSELCEGALDELDGKEDKK